MTGGWDFRIDRGGTFTEVVGRRPRRRRGHPPYPLPRAVTAGILANRRSTRPASVERADGRIEALGATARVAVTPGDVFVVETPGGGYGAT